MAMFNSSVLKKSFLIVVLGFVCFLTRCVSNVTLASSVSVFCSSSLYDLNGEKRDKENLSERELDNWHISDNLGFFGTGHLDAVFPYVNLIFKLDKKFKKFIDDNPFAIVNISSNGKDSSADSCEFCSWGGLLPLKKLKSDFYDFCAAGNAGNIIENKCSEKKLPFIINGLSEYSEKDLENCYWCFWRPEYDGLNSVINESNSLRERFHVKGKTSEFPIKEQAVLGLVGNDYCKELCSRLRQLNGKNVKITLMVEDNEHNGSVQSEEFEVKFNGDRQLPLFSFDESPVYGLDDLD